MLRRPPAAAPAEGAAAPFVSSNVSPALAASAAEDQTSPVFHVIDPGSTSTSAFTPVVVLSGRARCPAVARRGGGGGARSQRQRCAWLGHLAYPLACRLCIVASVKWYAERNNASRCEPCEREAVGFDELFGDDVGGSLYRAPSEVGSAQGWVSQGSGFEPDLLHDAHYVPSSCRWRFEIKLRLSF